MALERPLQYQTAMNEFHRREKARGLRLFHLQTLAAAYMGIWAISPPLAYGTNWRILAVLAAILWVGCESLRPNGVIRRPTMVVIAAAVYVLYTFAIELIVPDITEVTHFFQIWILCLFAVISESVRRRGGVAFLPYFYIVIILMPIWMIITLFGYENIAADISRTMSRASEEARELSAMGIGGYGLVYSLVLALPIFAYLSFKWPGGRSGGGRRRRSIKWLVRVNFLLAAFVVLKAGYTIALIVSAISLTVIALFIGQKRNVVLKSVLSALALTVVVGSLAGPVLESLEGVVKGTEYEQKFEDISYTLEYGDVAGTVETRWERYTRSTSLAMENILIGTLKFDHVGKHSSYLDTFAQYGVLVGAIFLFILLYRPYSYVKNAMVPQALTVSVFFVALLLPMVNRIFGAFGFMIFLFYPAGIAFIQEAKRSRAVIQAGGPHSPYSNATR